MSKTPMNILLIGSGGREHALAWKLKQSPLCDRLYVAPGNPGTAQWGENVTLDVSHHDKVIAFCESYAVALVVVGPEGPLVDGLVDSLQNAGIKAFGPSKLAAQVEGSKGFTKDLCQRAHIPTAAFQRFSDLASAQAYLIQRGTPIVIKADGLAAGKGVVVAVSLEEGQAALGHMFGGGLGAAGAEVVIEDYLEGEEVSFFAICDGTHAVPLTSAQDHKRAYDGDQGPNTGGMGAYSPAPVFTQALQDEVMARIIYPTLTTLQKEGIPYTGILYAGLMLTKDGPQLIEYNARFGDPETQVIMPRLEADLVELCLAAIEERLSEVEIKWISKSALTVVMAAQGYPGPVQTGSVIKNVENAEALSDVMVFHAGTELNEQGQLIAKGGRVLAVTAIATSIQKAQNLAYQGVQAIYWPDGFCRNDIGWRAI